MGCFEGFSTSGIVGEAVLANFGALRIVRVQAYGLTSLPRALAAPSGGAVDNFWRESLQLSSSTIRFSPSGGRNCGRPRSEFWSVPPVSLVGRGGRGLILVWCQVSRDRHVAVESQRT